MVFRVVCGRCRGSPVLGEELRHWEEQTRERPSGMRRKMLESFSTWHLQHLYTITSYEQKIPPPSAPLPFTVPACLGGVRSRAFAP